MSEDPKAAAMQQLIAELCGIGADEIVAFALAVQRPGSQLTVQYSYADRRQAACLFRDAAEALLTQRGAPVAGKPVPPMPGDN